MKKRYKKTIKPPRVTDHAILRYCERLLGFDLELVKSQILKSIPENHIDKLIDGKYPLIEGGKAVIKNHRIVTIVD